MNTGGKAISVCTIISDDDSNAGAKARHECNGGVLPLPLNYLNFEQIPHIVNVFLLKQFTT